jgi:DNA polymerase-3 subunit gamma/tau
MRASWTQVMGALENISRTSWLLLSNAQIFDFADDVLTLAFGSQGDIEKFRKLSAGKGPSEDLRQAITGVLGFRVKYLTRHVPGSGGGSAGGGAPDDRAPDGGAPGRQAPSAPPASPSSPASPAQSASDSGWGAASARPSASASSSARSAAPVTEWAVAPIPSDADAPPPDPGPASFAGQFPVDDEPEEAARARVATLAPAHEGDVLAPSDVAVSIARDEDEENVDTDLPADRPVPPVVVPPMTPTVSVRNDGVQRYGEAVVRQVLGATFLREETHESPTRFN